MFLAVLKPLRERTEGITIGGHSEEGRELHVDLIFIVFHDLEGPKWRKHALAVDVEPCDPLYALNLALRTLKCERSNVFECGFMVRWSQRLQELSLRPRALIQHRHSPFSGLHPGRSGQPNSRNVPENGPASSTCLRIGAQLQERLPTLLVQAAFSKARGRLKKEAWRRALRSCCQREGQTPMVDDHLCLLRALQELLPFMFNSNLS